MNILATQDTLPPELHAYSEAHMVVLSRLGALIESASQAPPAPSVLGGPACHVDGRAQAPE